MVMRIWHAVRGEGSVIVPEPGVLPSPGEWGPSSAFSPDSESTLHSPCWGGRAGGEELGWWRDAGRREIMEARLLDCL